MDIPLLPISLLKDLLRLEGSSKALTVRSPRGIEPLIGIYDKAMIPLTERLIERGALSVMNIFENMPKDDLTEFSAEEYEIDLFKNINTPLDL